MDAEQHLIAALICLFLKIKDLEHFFMCFLAIHVSSSVTCLDFPFLVVLFTFLYRICGGLKSCYQIHVVQILPPNLLLPHFPDSVFQRGKVFYYNTDLSIFFFCSSSFLH